MNEEVETHRCGYSGDRGLCHAPALASVRFNDAVLEVCAEHLSDALRARAASCSRDLECSHFATKIVRVIYVNEQVDVWRVCAVCSKRIGDASGALKRSTLRARGVDLDALPLFRDDRVSLKLPGSRS